MYKSKVLECTYYALYIPGWNGCNRDLVLIRPAKYFVSCSKELLDMMLVALGIILLAACSCCHAQTMLSGPQLVLQGRFSPGMASGTANLPQTFS